MLEHLAHQLITIALATESQQRDGVRGRFLPQIYLSEIPEYRDVEERVFHHLVKGKTTAGKSTCAASAPNRRGSPHLR